MQKKFPAILLLSGIFLFLWTRFPSSSLQAADEFIESARKSFFEKSGYVIGKLEEYNRLNNKYAPPLAFDCCRVIGLNANVWVDLPFEGIIYDPKGDRLEVRPAREFTIFVGDAKGVVRILFHNRGWSLIYSLRDKNW